MKMSYSREQTEFVVKSYLENGTRETVEKLATKLGKSTKSIIGKLSREGVYRREVYRSKTGDLPTTKTEIVSNIAAMLGVEVEDLVGLEKSPKQTLKNVEEALNGIEP